MGWSGHLYNSFLVIIEPGEQPEPGHYDRDLAVINAITAKCKFQPNFGQSNPDQADQLVLAINGLKLEKYACISIHIDLY